MRILYLGYWGANEGLSQATINPHLKILAEINTIDELHYISIERSQQITTYEIPENAKIMHHPYRSKSKIRILAKFLDLWRVTRKSVKLIKRKQVDLVICRSAMAGSIGYLIHRATGIRYLVESFEPHADYMQELGVWSKYGLSYLIQHRLEQFQKSTASHLMTASANYMEHLSRNENIRQDMISIMPCAVDSKQFKFNISDRTRVRKALGIEHDAIVGVYVGKFGDIYWDKEAFEVFKVAFSYFKNFFLIILTQHDEQFLNGRFAEFEIPVDRTWHASVFHKEVPAYLSASDFAISTIRPTPYRKFCSPIKNGEYWANGLPILSPDGIGDDSEIIKTEQGGVILDYPFKNSSQAYQDLSKFLNPSNPRPFGTQISSLAQKYRSFLHHRKLYKNVLTSLMKN